MAFQKGFCCLGRKCRHEAVVGLRKVHRQVVCLLFHAGDHHQHFAEIHLRLTGRMHQRYEHLLAAQHRCAHIVLHDRVAARESVLFL